MKTVNANPCQSPRSRALFSASVGRLTLVPDRRRYRGIPNPPCPTLLKPRQQRSGGLVSSLLFLAISGFLCPASLFAAAAYVQSAYTCPQAAQTTVSVSYSAAQGAGDLNVVVVGWNDTTNTVSSVTDSLGNAYQLAVGPTKESSSLTQSIYYAKNIVGGSNQVTVQFSGAAAYADIRILEYSGLDPLNPLDVAFRRQRNRHNQFLRSNHYHQRFGCPGRRQYRDVVHKSCWICVYQTNFDRSRRRHR